MVSVSEAGLGLVQLGFFANQRIVASSTSTWSHKLYRVLSEAMPWKKGNAICESKYEEAWRCKVISQQKTTVGLSGLISADCDNASEK